MNLRTARFVHGMTQIELQLKSGVFQSRLSLFERGHAIPSNNEKVKLETILGPIDWTSSKHNVCVQYVERRKPNE